MKIFKNKIIKHTIIPILIFVFLSTFLILSWFRYGLVYGGGDVGLQTYNSQIFLENSLSIWRETTAPGFPVPHGLVGIPLQFFQAEVQSLGFSPVATQAIVFWGLIFFAGYGMFKLGLVVFGKEKSMLAIFAGLFYLFNFYMMISVWHRFIHNTFFLAAALPYFYIFWRSWIREGKYLSLLAFFLTSFLAVFLFGALAFIVTFVLLLSFILLVEILFPWQGLKRSLVPVTRFLGGLIFWALLNFWWILPVFNLTPTILSSQHTTSGSLSTLLEISKQSIVPYVLLGINPFYLYYQLDFGTIYKNIFFLFSPWLIFIFIIPGFLRALRVKQLVTWPLLFLLAILLSKGAAEPFGYPYIWGFNNFFPLGIIRNPYEKLGILLPFSEAILATVGLSWYLNTPIIKRKAIKVSVGLLLVILFVINLWPMWSGEIFGSKGNLPLVEVPESYNLADKFVGADNKEKPGRILHLPLSQSDSNVYNWQHGYSGLDPSAAVFTSRPSLAHGTGVDYVDNALKSLVFAVKTEDNETKIKKLFQDFNVRYVILHKDIDWQRVVTESPEKIEQKLNTLSFLQKKNQFGQLAIYKVSDDTYSNKIYITRDYSYQEIGNGFEKWSPVVNDEQTKTAISDLAKNQDISNLLKGRQTTLLPSFSTTIPSKALVFKENAVNELPAIKFAPDSKKYSLVRLKESLQLLNPGGNRLNDEVDFAGKRLVEALKLKEMNSGRSVEKLMIDYQTRLPRIFDYIETQIGSRGEIPEYLRLTFLRHKIVLDQIAEKVNGREKEEVDNAIDVLNKSLIEFGVQTYFPLIGSSDISILNRLVYRFQVPIEGDYEILIPSDGSSLYENDLENIWFQIDNVLEKRKKILKGRLLSYGNFHFSRGIHEISYQIIDSKNLYQNPDNSSKSEVEIESENGKESIYNIKIEPFMPESSYQLKFEYWIRKGNSLTVKMKQDSDIDNGTRENWQYFKPLYSDSYNKYWTDFDLGLKPQIGIKPRDNSSEVAFQIIVGPWTECAQLLQTDACNLKTNIKKDSDVIIRNIRLYREFDNPIFLKSDGEDLKSSPIPISFEEKNPMLYQGRISIQEPGFFIFNETFDNGWKLKLFRNNKTYMPQPHIQANIYGNAWFIDQVGEYDFYLQFDSADDFKKGIFVSLMTLAGLVSFGIFSKKR